MLNPRRLGVGMEGAGVTPLPLSVTTIGPPIFIALTMRQGLLTTAYTVDDCGVGVHGAGGHGPDGRGVGGVGGGSKELAGHHVEGPGAQVVGGKTVPKSTGTARNGGERLSIASATVQSASSTS